MKSTRIISSLTICDLLLQLEKYPLLGEPLFARLLNSRTAQVVAAALAAREAETGLEGVVVRAQVQIPQMETLLGAQRVDRPVAGVPQSCRTNHMGKSINELAQRAQIVGSGF